MKIQALLAYSSEEEMQSGISAEALFIWRTVQNATSVSTGGATQQKEVVLLSFTPSLLWSTPQPQTDSGVCQNHIMLRLCSNFLLLLSSAIPCTPLLLFSYSNISAHHTRKTTFSPSSVVWSRPNPKKSVLKNPEKSAFLWGWNMFNISYRRLT